jgi:uncharacterized protein
MNMTIEKLVTTSTMQKIENTSSVTLESFGEVANALTSPACQIKGLKKVIPGKEDIRTGIWECTPGKFQREMDAAELMYIISGSLTFTSHDGESIDMNPGDTVFMPPNSNGVWDVKETVRKVYILF